MPCEFLGVAKELAGGLGELIGCNKRNATSSDQRFCVGLETGTGWKTHLSVQNDETGEKAIIVVDYSHLPIQCRCCLSTEHLVKDCRGSGGKTETTKSVGDSQQSARSGSLPILEGPNGTPAEKVSGEDEIMQEVSAPLPGPPPLALGQKPNTLVASTNP